MMELPKRHCGSGFSLGPFPGGPGPARSGRRARRMAPARRARGRVMDPDSQLASCQSGSITAAPMRSKHAQPLPAACQALPA